MEGQELIGRAWAADAINTLDPRAVSQPGEVVDWVKWAADLRRVIQEFEVTFEEARQSAQKTAKAVLATRDGLLEHLQDKYHEVRGMIATAMEAHPDWKVEGATLIDSWEPEIEDFSKVPDEYKMVDLAAIKKAGAAVGPLCAIEGVRWNKKQTLRIG